MFQEEFVTGWTGSGTTSSISTILRKNTVECLNTVSQGIIPFFAIFQKLARVSVSILFNGA